jgi:UDP:flavonoid glycosyltransferase YjiC (YdhE family)
MKVAIATLGTQGDVQPYMALALELERRGHDVVLGSNSDFEGFVTSHGLKFHNLEIEIQSFIAQGPVEQIVAKGAIFNIPGLFMTGQRMVDHATQRAWEMAQDADILLINMNTTFGIDIAEALDIPVMAAAPQPLNTTSEFPLCAYSGPTLGGTLNRASYGFMKVQQAYYNISRNRQRQRVMGLGPLSSRGFFKGSDGSYLPTLYCYSSIVAPRPGDWPETSVVTGYWRLEDRMGWEPSPEFREFLYAGPAPVYIGFGSMPYGTERNTQLLRDGIARWGGRAVVARGWGGIDTDKLGDRVFAIDAAPHDKLFPLVQAVVHHGGAGTTAAALFAGKPAFVVPQTVDQPFWAKRVHALGAGPEPVKLNRLTPEILADSLTELTSNPSYASAAQAVSQRLMAENGPAVASEIVEDVVARYVPHRERRLRA